MSEMKMENSRVPAEKIFNPDLKEAIVTMQEDNSKENVDKMITEVVKAKFILPAKVVPTTQAVTENGQTVMKQATQVQFRLLENQKKEKFFGLFTDTEELFKWQDTQNSCASSRSPVRCGCALTASTSSTGWKRAGPGAGSAGAGKSPTAPLP